MEEKIKKPGRMGPRGPMMAVDKARDFKGSLKRLIKYIGKYNAAIILAFSILALSTVLSVMSPKILGKATTRLGENIIEKIAYTSIQKSIESIPDNVKSMIPEDATIQTLIDMNIIPQEVNENMTDDIRSMSIFNEPKMDFNYIAEILIIVSIIYVISAILGFATYRIMAYISQKVTYNLRKEVDEKLDKLPLSFYDKHTHGEILSRITNDIDNISMMLQQSMNQIIQSVFTVIGILIMMLSISFSMTLVALVIIPVSLGFVALVVKKSQKYFMAQQRIIGNLNSIVEETYSADTVVKSFNMQNRQINKFENANNELYITGWKAQFLSGLMMPIINAINNLGYIGICILGAKLAIDGKMTIGNIQAFIQYMNQFTQPIAQSANMINMIQGTVASAERVFEILDEKEEEKEQINLVKLDDVKGNVSCESVKFSYNKEESLIEDWSLDVKSGQTVAIVGPTGAGKTTIVNLLMRFYEIDGGDIKIDGVSIKNISKNDLRKMFAMVLQDTWLFNGTIRENLRYAKEDATDEEVEKAAWLAHTDHFIRSLPNGYDFVLNEDATNISQGQKQLLTIARAILANSKMLILDEATSNVDTRTEELIQKAMNKLMKGKTTFVIAHRLSTIKNADIILVMQHGRIVERGTHEELLKRSGVYADLYNSQFSEESA